MKLFCLAIFLTFISCFDACSQKGQRAIDFYAAAVRSFNASGYAESIKLAGQAETLLGRTTAVTTALKVRNYFALKKYDRVKALLLDFFKIEAHPDLTQEMLVYAGKLDKLAMQAQMKKFERDLQAAAEKHREVQFKLRGLNVQPLIHQKFNAFKALQPGKVYIFRKKNPSRVYERSYFVFYDDRYIIYTLPNPSPRLLLEMRKEATVFDSDHANNSRLFNADAVVTRPLIPTNVGEKRRAFQKSLVYSNVFLGGNGDELLWSGRQNSTYEEDVYYFYFGNRLYADIEMRLEKPSGNQPLVETGEIKKEADYRLISDNSLLASIKEEGFADVGAGDMPRNGGMKIYTTNSTRNRQMLYTQKKIVYQLKGKVPVGYAIGNDVYSGNVLYYKPLTISAFYGFRAFPSDYRSSDDLLSSLIQTQNNIEVSKNSFDRLYSSLNKKFDNLENRYFTSPDYTLPMDLALKMSRAIPARAALLHKEINSLKELALLELTRSEKKPRFPGGKEGLATFLKKSIRSPTEVYKGAGGRVVVEFVVSAEGQVEDAKIIEGVHPVLDEEALRVINLMPTWMPAEQGGKAVMARQTLPISIY